jgi:hypothetical protein
MVGTMDEILIMARKCEEDGEKFRVKRRAGMYLKLIF